MPHLRAHLPPPRRAEAAHAHAPWWQRVVPRPKPLQEPGRECRTGVTEPAAVGPAEAVAAHGRQCPQQQCSAECPTHRAPNHELQRPDGAAGDAGAGGGDARVGP